MVEFESWVKRVLISTDQLAPKASQKAALAHSLDQLHPGNYSQAKRSTEVGTSF